MARIASISRVLFFLVAFALLGGLYGCVGKQLQQSIPTSGADPVSSTAEPLNGTPITLPNGTGWDLGDIAVYFTNPRSVIAYQKMDGIEQYLARSIDASRVSIDIAIYHFDNYTLQKAILDAYHRGVSVRMVTESDNQKDFSTTKLRDAGIPIVLDTNPGLMHDKFVIIDGVEVWTGSANFSDNSFYQDWNNLIRIRSRQLAQNYQQEFNLMFDRGIFGWKNTPALPYPSVFINGKQIENMFSPDDEPARRIVEILNGSKKSIYFYNYALTGEDFGDAMVRAKDRGVDVSGILDDQLAKGKGSEMEKLTSHGISVNTDDNSSLLHHKVFIIDEAIVIVGSYNFSANAERRNDENLLIIHDPTVAQAFLAEFRVLNTIFAQ